MPWVDFWDMLDGVLWGVLLKAGKAQLPEKRAMTKEQIAIERDKLRELCKAKI